MGALQYCCDQIESAVMHVTAPLVLDMGWAGMIDLLNRFNTVRMIWAIMQEHHRCLTLGVLA